MTEVSSLSFKSCRRERKTNWSDLAWLCSQDCVGQIWPGSADKVVSDGGKKKTEEIERANFLLLLPVILLENFNRHTTFFSHLVYFIATP